MALRFTKYLRPLAKDIFVVVVLLSVSSIVSFSDWLSARAVTPIKRTPTYRPITTTNQSNELKSILSQSTGIPQGSTSKLWSWPTLLFTPSGAKTTTTKSTTTATRQTSPTPKRFIPPSPTPTPAPSPSPQSFSYTPPPNQPNTTTLKAISSSGTGWQAVGADSFQEAAFNKSNGSPDSYIEFSKSGTGKAMFKLSGLPEDFVRASSARIFITSKLNEADSSWQTHRLVVPLSGIHAEKNNLQQWQNAVLVIEGSNERTTRYGISPIKWRQRIAASIDSYGAPLTGRDSTSRLSVGDATPSAIRISNIIVELQYEDTKVQTSSTSLWQNIKDPTNNPANETYINGRGESNLFLDLTDVPADFTKATAVKTTLIRRHQPNSPQNYLNTSITTPSGTEMYTCGGEGGYKEGSDWDSLDMGCLQLNRLPESYFSKEGWNNARLLISVKGIVDVSAAEVEITYLPAGSTSPKTVTLRPSGDGIVRGSWSSGS